MYSMNIVVSFPHCQDVENKSLLCLPPACEMVSAAFTLQEVDTSDDV